MSSQQFHHLLVVTFMFLGSPEYFSLTQISLVNCLNLDRKFTAHQKKKKKKINIKKTMKPKKKKKWWLETLIFMWLLAAVIVALKYIILMQGKINTKYGLCLRLQNLFWNKNNIHMWSGIKSKYFRGIRD